MIVFKYNAIADFNEMARILSVNDMGRRSRAKLEQAVAASFLTISAYYDNQMVGCARVISDGVYYAFLCDVAVKPAFQRQGIGTAMVNKILKILRAKKFRMIGLFTSKKTRIFYEQFGFVWQKNIRAMIKVKI